MKFLQTTMQAHLKLSEEVHPDELAAHAGSTDPVAAALASRRQKLAAVEEKFHHLLDSHLPPCADAQHMDGYYTILEASLKQKDADAVEFQKVLQGAWSRSALTAGGVAPLFVYHHLCINLVILSSSRCGR